MIQYGINSRSITVYNAKTHPLLFLPPFTMMASNSAPTHPPNQTCFEPNIEGNHPTIPSIFLNGRGKIVSGSKVERIKGSAIILEPVRSFRVSLRCAPRKSIRNPSGIILRNTLQPFLSSPQSPGLLVFLPSIWLSDSSRWGGRSHRGKRKKERKRQRSFESRPMMSAPAAHQHASDQSLAWTPRCMLRSNTTIALSRCGKEPKSRN